ncbi:MAG: penicillin-binding transpeptidase domain-containing protein [Candidatus Alcyoniella australis]|nr:penicillin-binding transpeptidase domain-containing protein [Candidatus Alcyoniella australis]
MLCAAFSFSQLADADPGGVPLDVPNGVLLAIDCRSGEVLLLSGDRSLLAKPQSVGSLIKPLLMLAAYEQGDFDFRGTIFCPLRSVETPANRRCWLAAGHGQMQLEAALAQSCNVYFMAVARQTDYNAYRRVLARLGIEAPSSPTDPATLMIGLDPALRARPFDLLAAYVALFNGGLLFSMDPAHPLQGARVVRKVELGSIDLDRLTTGLIASATQGTAHRAGQLNPGLPLLAKTGTSPADGSGQGNGWCVLLTPTHDPRVAMIALVQGGTGPDNAAPLAGAAMRYLVESGVLDLSGATLTPGQ